MIIALASPRVAPTIDDGLERVERLAAEAASRGASVVCFPEAYLPGLRGQDFEVPPFGPEDEARVLRKVAAIARGRAIAVILGMERASPAGRQIAAVVFDASGRLLGQQVKVQLDPAEEAHYVAGHGRQVFEIDGVTVGIAICHEGFRYPETVRWAATRGAKVVFHPHLTGSDRAGVTRAAWGEASAPYYERAIQMRSIENTIYVASVNYATRFQESATCLIEPAGTCQAFLPYGEEGVLVQDLDLSRATGQLALRYAPDRY